MGRLVLALAVAGALTGPVRAQFGADISPASPVNLAASDVEGDRFPYVATDAGGASIVIWRASDSGTTTIRLARHTDDGVGWTAPQDLLVSTATNHSPHIATDGEGVWIAEWESADPLDVGLGADLDILLSRSVDGGATWSAPYPADAGATTDLGDDGWFRLSPLGSDHWVGVWHSQNDVTGDIGGDFDILVATSADGGLTWTASSPLNTDAASDAAGAQDLFPSIAANEAGHLVSVWKRTDAIQETVDVLAAYSVDGGFAWSDPITVHRAYLSDVAGADSYAYVAAGRDGAWVAVWQTRDPLGSTLGEDLDLLVSRSRDGGAHWTPAAPLLSQFATDGDGTLDGYPFIAQDPHGDWVVTWSRLGYPGNADHDVFVTRSRDNGRSWSEPEPLNLMAQHDRASDFFSRIAATGDGRWRAAWTYQSFEDGPFGTDAEIVSAEWAFCRIDVDNADATRIILQPQAVGPPFEVVSGSLAALRDSASFDDAICLGAAGTDPVLDETELAPGEGRYYLARAFEQCASAGFGAAAVDPDPREELVVSSPCR